MHFQHLTYLLTNLSITYLCVTYCCKCRVPLKNVELNIGGSWSSLRRDVSNSWNSNGLSYKAPFHLRLTSVLGDVVEDYIPSNSGGQGSSQFPEITPDLAGAQAGVQALTSAHPGKCSQITLVSIVVWSRHFVEKLP